MASPSAGRLAALLVLSLALTPPACTNVLPSAQLGSRIELPVPATTGAEPDPARFDTSQPGEKLELTARSLIPIAFNNQPDIKASYERFKSEEARYDFFYSSRDALTPRLKTSSSAGESRGFGPPARFSGQTVELSVEKQFFDTTRMSVATGLRRDALDHDEAGTQGFVAAQLRYPLWGSREKLERTSEDIFQRNELNDAQLGYIQTARQRLQRAMFRYYECVQISQALEHANKWREDLQELFRRMDQIQVRDVSTDRSRVEAELPRVNVEIRNLGGRFEVELARLKAACGLHFNAQIELIDVPFNPFEGAEQDVLLQASIATDPEIATLQNELTNSEVQLNLARRGTWDIALLFSGDSNLEGSGDTQGVSDWQVTVGFEVSHVDARVTTSLIHQAQSRIARFTQGIAARENDIFVDTLEPLIRIDTLSASRNELQSNLQRFEDDYQTGLQKYFTGALNIDDLLKRRELLYEQEREIARLRMLVGFNVAELCSATGRFFELLEPDQPG